MATDSNSPASSRLMSLDALRGFDMFWIMGGDALASALGALSNDPVTQTISSQLTHVAWAGFHFYDLVFPLFVFIVGVSIVFSLTKALEQHGPAGAMKRVFTRFAIMFAVALFYSGGFANAWPEIRLLGVLNRIALCYLGAALIFCLFRNSWKSIASIAGGLLVGYWALMSFVPVPDLRPITPNGELISTNMTATSVAQLNWNTTNTLTGVFEPGLNLANYLDSKYLPGRKHDKLFDPEGLLSTLPAVGSCLLGVLAGLLLSNRRVDDRKKVTILIVAGVASVIAGFTWGTQFPVIKKIWTSSFVLVTAGYSALLLGAFYLVIDVWKKQSWCQPFVWYGMNPITVYLADNLLGFRRVASRLLGTDVKAFLDAHVMNGFGDLMLSFGEIGVGLCLVWFLYRRKIFLRM